MIGSDTPGHVSMPGVHRVAALVQRWLLGTHHGAAKPEQLAQYLDEFVFLFNHRTSLSRGIRAIDYWHKLSSPHRSPISKFPTRKISQNERSGTKRIAHTSTQVSQEILAHRYKFLYNFTNDRTQARAIPRERP
jgi:hypothetical protein